MAACDIARQEAGVLVDHYRNKIKWGYYSNDFYLTDPYGKARDEADLNKCLYHKRAVEDAVTLEQLEYKGGTL